MDLTNPLLERCKFLSIFTSNLDEFIQVRLGSLMNQTKDAPAEEENKTNMTAKELLKRFGVTNIVISDLGVKEGILKSIVQGKREQKGLSLEG